VKSIVKVLGYIKLIDMLDGKLLPFVAESDDGDFWIIGENDEVQFQSKAYVKEVIRF
jgi:hypothetical protein